MAVVALLALLFLFNPAASRYVPPCPMHHLTGLYCPGCGSLRATHHLLHGRIAGAMAMNPLMVVSLPILAAMARRPPWVYTRWVPWTAFTVLIAYGVLRNLPWWPFCTLAPGP